MIIIFQLHPFWRTLVKLSQITAPRKYISKQTSKQSAKINVPRASCSKKRFQTKTRFETQAKPFFPYQIAAPSKFVLIAPKHRNGTSKFDRLLCLEYLGQKISPTATCGNQVSPKQFRKSVYIYIYIEIQKISIKYL